MVTVFCSETTDDYYHNLMKRINKLNKKKQAKPKDDTFDKDIKLFNFIMTFYLKVHSIRAKYENPI